MFVSVGVGGRCTMKSSSQRFPLRGCHVRLLRLRHGAAEHSVVVVVVVVHVPLILLALLVVFRRDDDVRF